MKIYSNLERILKDMATPYLNVDKASKIKYAEVFTPIWLIDEQLDNCFSKEDFANPNLKWLDPANGIGNYTIRLIQKLLVGLKDCDGLEDENIRYKWILENMIYVCEIQPMNMFAYLYFVDPNNEYKINYYRDSFLETAFDDYSKNIWNVDKFDRIIGNPPYQIKDNGAKASAKPIYNFFIQKSIMLLNKDGVLSFITPSRWFGGGKGLDLFRKQMMSSNKLASIKHFEDETMVFGKNVRIAGGVSYFRYDLSYNGNCLFNGFKLKLDNLDIIVTKINGLKLISKFLDIPNILSIFNPRSYYNIQTNDVRLKTNQVNPDYVRCYVSQKNGLVKWIDKNSLRRTDSDKWRVLTPRANGQSGSGFGNIFISSPGEYYSDTYISFISNTQAEAESIASFLKTDLANYLLSVRKVSQDVSSETLKWIPLVPFDREWNNDNIAEWFNLTQEDKKLISNGF
jgi:site-specific DNA-methyltransferase (adenine-specific)